MAGIIRDQIKLQHSNQESTENASAVYRKEIELLKTEMKKKEDLIKILLDTIKELTAAKSQPLNKGIPSFVVDSNSNSDLDSPRSIENSEPPSEKLTQEVNLNNADGHEPPQSKKKAVIARPIGGSKEEEEKFYASKKVI